MAPINKNLLSRIKSGNTVDVKDYKESVLSENAKNRDGLRRFLNRNDRSSNKLNLRNRDADLPNLRFPEDLGIYYIGFEFSKYEKPNINVRPKSLISAHVALPIPSTLVDPLQARWEEEEVGLLGYAIDEYKNNGGDLKKIQEDLTNKLAAAGGDPTSGAAAIGQLLQIFARGINQNFSNAINQLKQNQGLAFNPYLAFFYNGPAFKKHRFVWRFSPRDEKESETLKEIIRLFHFHQSPTLSFGGIFFNYPSIVTPKLYTNDLDTRRSRFLYDFKSCVLESVIVNYAPNGIPSFFRGTRAPTEIEIELNLAEISLWLRDDYDDTGDRNNSGGK